MRSLHVITSTARRGAETFAVELAAELRRSGDGAHVVALTDASDRSAHDVEVLGRSRRSPSVLGGLRVHAERADVVVAHGSSTLEACAISLLASSTPFVYRTIGDPSYWASTPARRSLLGLLHRRAARHVVLWHNAGDQLADHYRLPRQRIDVIPNAVQADRWSQASESERVAARSELGAPEGQPCLAFVGALSAEKNVHAVLEVARQLPEAVVFVAGTGPERASLELIARQIDPTRIRFLGSLPDPRPVYAAADLLLLPSLSEGMPGVVIEAGLVGTATVASSVGAIPELILDGDTGFLSPPGDLSGFCTAVANALPLAGASGDRAAIEFRRSFTMEVVAPQWSRSLLQACG